MFVNDQGTKEPLSCYAVVPMMVDPVKEFFQQAKGGMVWLDTLSA